MRRIGGAQLSNAAKLSRRIVAVVTDVIPNRISTSGFSRERRTRRKHLEHGPSVFHSFEKPTELGDDVFKEIQRCMPTLDISPETRSAIRLIVSVYEGQVTTRRSLRGSVVDRDRARLISEYCAKLLQKIAELREDNPLLAHTLLVPKSVSLSYDDILSALEYYRGIFEAFAASAKKGPVARRPQLHRLLDSLALHYRQSGGVSTAVSNSREESEFIDFAWAIIKCLPTIKRPNGRKGLAEEWEACRANHNVPHASDSKPDERQQGKRVAKKPRQRG